MEADWEIEIGGDAPVIETLWPGFVDLRAKPERVAEIAETKLQAELAETLQRLNSPRSIVWTSKCDVFEPDQIDAVELDATAADAANAISCYIDLLARGNGWSTPDELELFCRIFCGALRKIPLSHCRVDLVVRRAMLRGRDGLGLTAYLTGCGPTEEDAKARLALCLGVFGSEFSDWQT